MVRSIRPARFSRGVGCAFLLVGETKETISNRDCVPGCRLPVQALSDSLRMMRGVGGSLAVNRTPLPVSLLMQMSLSD